MVDTNPKTPICNATERILKELALLIEGNHPIGNPQPGFETLRVEALNEENQRIINISIAITDLLLLNRESNINLSRLDYRRTQLSQIVQLTSTISSGEEADVGELRQEISKVIAILLADIYSDC